MDETTRKAEPISAEIAQLQLGSYRVIHPLGAGGMSSVYRAVHIESGHEVALKVLPRYLAKKPIVLQRFLREARSAESLEHPNIVSIYDRGVDQGRHYLVLEYVAGGDLHDYVQQHGPMSVAAATEVIRMAARGLRYAASRGVIHRDIKPSNILRSPSGEIKITDLGLALQADHEDERVTREGTTVGTVDYMAPEQARDSRATSVQSDLYSLGCTFYYLLTGLPPFPGGDITDKLTRHAKSPPPDVRDLRPEIHESTAEILLRMMAKRPEDRFQTYDDLISALDASVTEADADLAATTLVPLESEQRESVLPFASRADDQTNGAGSIDRPSSSLPEISLSHLVSEDVRDASAEPIRSPALGPPAVLPRQGAADSALIPAGERASNRPSEDFTASFSARGWIWTCVLVGAFCILSVIGVDQLMRLSSPSSSPPIIRDRIDLAERQGAVTAPLNATSAATTRGSEAGARSNGTHHQKTAATPGPARTTAFQDWIEPEDQPDAPAPADTYTRKDLDGFLPEWARNPVPDRVDGPVIQVRRGGESRDPAIVPTLRMGFDAIKGTTEIADEGPFLIDDPRIAGENRLVRSRPGFRSMIRIERPTLGVVRDQPGVFVLDGKSLILDSLDIVVNLKELPPSQKCLFWCVGGTLTLRNCTITFLNPGSEPFTFLHAEGSGTRGSRIRIEQTLVRGAVTSIFELGRGASEVVVWKSILLAGTAPIVGFGVAEPAAARRLAIVESVLASCGPIVEIKRSTTGMEGQKLVIRALGTVFGKFRGAGIASVIATNHPTSNAADLIDWLGAANLFCGWKGYFASGAENVVRIRNLESLRSTWNATDQESREILADWPQPRELALASAADLEPFLPRRNMAIECAAKPRPYWFEKTVSEFAPPNVPLPARMPLATLPSNITHLGAAVNLKDRLIPQAPFRRNENRPPIAIHSPAQASADLTFDADQSEWKGDLGAFLRDKFVEGAKHARVRIVGSGVRRCSPVRLPDGLVLELRVDAPASTGAEWLTFLPEAESAGRALIELRGGSLILSRFRIRADESAAIESLIHVEDGDLLLDECELTALAGAEGGARQLISFRAAGTKPRPGALESSSYSAQIDRPVCAFSDCVLITRGTAIRAEVGKGLVALTHCAVSAGRDALDLVPARVSRSRFENDLWLDHCTMASESNIIRLDSWPGVAPGPDRPWLIWSRNTAFLSPYDRRARETSLLRTGSEALAQGIVFWHGTDDALETDAFLTVGDGPISSRPRDVVLQWVNLWGSNHVRGITGPRISGGRPSVRLLEGALRPGQVEPADLILDPGYHPGRRQLEVGADLSRQGINPRPPVGGRRR